MISACLIAKNEEKWIGDCLRHLKPHVAEMIVVDTGSTDKTMEIARAEGARVSQVKWENDFAKARNVSLDKATQRWILIIDPDERIAEKDFAKIKALTEKKDIMAYSFDTRNYSSNTLASGFKPSKGEYAEEKGYAGYFESRKVRLFQNIPTIRFVGSVHELVESTIKGRIEVSTVPFHHYGSTDEVTKEKGKHQLYQSQGAKKIQEQPNDWKAHFELGIEYLTAGEPVKAVKDLEKANQLKPSDPLILSNLGYAYMESGKLDRARTILDECLKKEPSHHDALLNRGVTEMRAEKWNEAFKYFQMILKVHPNSFSTYRNMGLCFAHQKQFKQAAECFDRALKIFPQYNEARIDLGLVCFAGGRPDIAKGVLEQAIKIDPRAMRAQLILEDVNKLLTQAAQKKK